MASHYRVSPKFWIKARKRGWNDQQITLALYLLTCEHRNLEGLYRIPKAYIAADLDWPMRRVEDCMTTLVEAGFAQYDESAMVVLIPKALKFQSPSTENQIKGAVAQIERIPRTSLWDAFRMACASHCPRLADAIEDRWPSDTDAPSRTRAGSRAPASSSTSNSISTPPAGETARPPASTEFRLEQIELPGGDLARLDGSDFVQRRIDGAIGGWVRDNIADDLHADDGIALVRALLAERIRITPQNFKDADRVARTVAAERPGAPIDGVVAEAVRRFARSLRQEAKAA